MGDVPRFEEPWKPGALTAEQKLDSADVCQKLPLCPGRPLLPWPPEVRGGGGAEGASLLSQVAPRESQTPPAFPSRLFEQVREKMPGLPGRHFWG